MPPRLGGMNEQDYRDTITYEFLDRVYSTILHWRKGKMNDSEKDLIIWLTKEGLMGK